MLKRITTNKRGPRRAPPMAQSSVRRTDPTAGLVEWLQPMTIQYPQHEYTDMRVEIKTNASNGIARYKFVVRTSTNKPATISRFRPRYRSFLVISCRRLCHKQSTTNISTERHRWPSRQRLIKYIHITRSYSFFFPWLVRRFFRA